jgi:uncharacterized protein (DUF58 family)
MLPREILRQIRRLQIRARRAVDTLLGGEYHSVFKGAGLAFDEVRAYQPGDDVRAIDWNVTARMGQPFLKRFVEERELTVLLVVDVSGSLRFGTRRQAKREVAAELAALLAFSAAANNDRVGLIQFSDRVEHFVPAAKGTRHMLRIVRDVLYFEPAGRRTRLALGLDFLNRVQRRRAVVFLLSDFLDRGYDQALTRAARRHDLVAVRLSDPLEAELPDAGFLEVEDAETGEQRLLDTGSSDVRDAWRGAARQRRDSVVQLLRATRTDLIEVSTDGGHLDALTRFFQLRERRLRRG